MISGYVVRKVQAKQLNIGMYMIYEEPFLQVSDRLSIIDEIVEISCDGMATYFKIKLAGGNILYGPPHKVYEVWVKDKG